MTSNTADKVFAGSIPKIYDTHLVPLIFQPYADDLARRVASRKPRRVLEIAAGTGVVTRALAALLPERTEIVATDLNQAMLDHALTIGTRQPEGRKRRRVKSSRSSPGGCRPQRGCARDG